MENSCEKYGKLYAYFLEVCRHFIDQKLHEEMGVSDVGQEFYEDLNRRLSDQRGEPYEDIIKKCGFLLENEKRYLLPENRIIDLEDLDVTIHFKIIRLLRGSVAKKLACHVAEVRNYLCHVPVANLREGMDSEDFSSLFQLIRQNLEDAGITKDLLKWCEKKILKRK